MPLSINELQNIAQLAYLDSNPDEIAALGEEINSIIEFVHQLSQRDTANIAPLFHPLNVHQRLRSDEVSEESCLEELAEIAPFFDNNMYLVPQVIEVDSE